MASTPPPVSRPGYPPSPCNRVCTLNDDNVCIGCQRTLDEIVGWSAMSAGQQWSIVKELVRRGGGQ